MTAGATVEATAVHPTGRPMTIAATADPSSLSDLALYLHKLRADKLLEA